MLELDLGRLERRGRVPVHEDVPAEDPMWAGAELRLGAPLVVRLEAQRAGWDVLVRGRVAGVVEIECRRCLARVALGIDEPVSILFRRGVDRVEAEHQEVYALPDRARELDLREPIRELVLLAVPRFALCGEACRGLCPRCGANWNEAACECEVVELDDRWAPLRGVKLDG